MVDFWQYEDRSATTRRRAQGLLGDSPSPRLEGALPPVDRPDEGGQSNLVLPAWAKDYMPAEPAYRSPLSTAWNGLLDLVNIPAEYVGKPILGAISAGIMPGEQIQLTPGQSVFQQLPSIYEQWRQTEEERPSLFEFNVGPVNISEKWFTENLLGDPLFWLGLGAASKTSKGLKLLQGLNLGDDALRLAATGSFDDVLKIAAQAGKADDAARIVKSLRTARWMDMIDMATSPFAWPGALGRNVTDTALAAAGRQSLDEVPHWLRWGVDLLEQHPGARKATEVAGRAGQLAGWGITLPMRASLAPYTFGMSLLQKQGLGRAISNTLGLGELAQGLGLDRLGEGLMRRFMQGEEGVWRPFGEEDTATPDAPVFIQNIVKPEHFMHWKETPEVPFTTDREEQVKTTMWGKPVYSDGLTLWFDESPWPDMPEQVSEKSGGIIENSLNQAPYQPQRAWPVDVYPADEAGTNYNVVLATENGLLVLIDQDYFLPTVSRIKTPVFYFRGSHTPVEVREGKEPKAIIAPAFVKDTIPDLRWFEKQTGIKLEKGGGNAPYIVSKMGNKSYSQLSTDLPPSRGNEEVTPARQAAARERLDTVKTSMRQAIQMGRTMGAWFDIVRRDKVGYDRDQGLHPESSYYDWWAKDGARFSADLQLAGYNSIPDLWDEVQREQTEANRAVPTEQPTEPVEQTPELPVGPYVRVEPSLGPRRQYRNLLQIVQPGDVVTMDFAGKDDKVLVERVHQREDGSISGFSGRRIVVDESGNMRLTNATFSTDGKRILSVERPQPEGMEQPASQGLNLASAQRHRELAAQLSELNQRMLALSQDDPLRGKLWSQRVEIEKQMHFHEPAVISEAAAETRKRKEREAAEQPAQQPTQPETRPDPYAWAEHLKAKGTDRQMSWSRWVQVTNLNPGMDAKDWYAIYDRVTPYSHPELDTVQRQAPGAATHILTETYNATPKRVRVTEDTPTHISWVDEHGFTGGTPRQYIQSLEPVGQEGISREHPENIPESSEGQKTQAKDFYSIGDLVEYDGKVYEVGFVSGGVVRLQNPHNSQMDHEQAPHSLVRPVDPEAARVAREEIAWLRDGFENDLMHYRTFEEVSQYITANPDSLRTMGYESLRELWDEVAAITPVPERPQSEMFATAKPDPWVEVTPGEGQTVADVIRVGDRVTTIREDPAQYIVREINVRRRPPRYSAERIRGDGTPSGWYVNLSPEHIGKVERLQVAGPAESSPNIPGKSPEIAETSGQKQPWQMTREEYANTYGGEIWNELAAHGSRGSGTEVHYRVLDPGPAGPFTGQMVVEGNVSKGEEIDTPWGRGVVTSRRSVTRRKRTSMADATQETHQRHENYVRQAISQGKSIPPEVLRDYPDLVPQQPAEMPNVVEDTRTSTNIPESSRVSGQSASPMPWAYTEDAPPLVRQMANPERLKRIHLWRGTQNVPFNPHRALTIETTIWGRKLYTDEYTGWFDTSPWPEMGNIPLAEPGQNLEQNLSVAPFEPTRAYPVTTFVIDPEGQQTGTIFVTETGRVAIVDEKYVIPAVSRLSQPEFYFRGSASPMEVRDNGNPMAFLMPINPKAFNRNIRVRIQDELRIGLDTRDEQLEVFNVAGRDVQDLIGTATTEMPPAQPAESPTNIPEDTRTLSNVVEPSGTQAEQQPWELERDEFIHQNLWRYGKDDGEDARRTRLGKEYDDLVDDALRRGLPVPMASRQDWALPFDVFAAHEWGSDDQGRALIEQHREELRKDHRDAVRYGLRNNKYVPPELDFVHLG